jgi:hypothetical protein
MRAFGQDHGGITDLAEGGAKDYDAVWIIKRERTP